MKLKSTTLASACFLTFITSNARAGMFELVGNK